MPLKNNATLLDRANKLAYRENPLAGHVTRDKSHKIDQRQVAKCKATTGSFSLTAKNMAKPAVSRQEPSQLVQKVAQVFQQQFSDV